MTDARAFLCRETLRDGTRVVIRAARADDRERIARAFASLDRESVYTRFFAFKRELSEAELDALDTMDFRRDVMLVVTADDHDAIVASARCIAGPGKDASSAEVAFTVTEPFRGKGIAGRLLAHLQRIAADAGLTRLEADVLPGNRAMLAVFERAGLPLTTRRQDGVVHVVLTLPSPSRDERSDVAEGGPG